MQSLFFVIISFLLFSFQSKAQVVNTTLARQYLDSLLINRSSRNFDQAFSYGEKALNIYKESYGEKDTMTAKVYYLLGTVLYEKRDLDASLKIQKNGLDIWLNNFGEEYADVGTFYHFIGLIYKVKGDYYKALSYYEKAMIIRRKVLGSEHFDLSKTYNNLGIIYYEIGYYATIQENVQDEQNKNPKRNQ